MDAKSFFRTYMGSKYMKNYVDAHQTTFKKKFANCVLAISFDSTKVLLHTRVFNFPWNFSCFPVPSIDTYAAKLYHKLLFRFILSSFLRLLRFIDFCRTSILASKKSMRNGINLTTDFFVHYIVCFQKINDPILNFFRSTDFSLGEKYREIHITEKEKNLFSAHITTREI